MAAEAADSSDTTQDGTEEAGDEYDENNSSPNNAFKNNKLLEAIKNRSSLNLTYIEQLLNDGADVNARDNDGNTALMYATEQSNIYTEYFDVVALLLNEGADVTKPNDEGKTALSFMEKDGKGKYIIKKMLDNTDVNEKLDDSNENTILILAAMNNHSEVVKYLLKNGANKTITNNEGKTALDMAKKLQTTNESAKKILKLLRDQDGGGKKKKTKKRKKKTKKKKKTHKRR